MSAMRKRIYELLDAGTGTDVASRAVDYALMVLISANVIAVIFESMPEVEQTHRALFSSLEVFSVTIFTIEYIARVWAAVEKQGDGHDHPIIGRLRYMLTPMAVLDLLVLLPFFFPNVLNVDLRMLRALRLLRVLRLTRYSSSMALLINVLHDEARNIGAALFVLILLIVMAGGLSYYAEREVQPEAFGSIPAALWWAVVTMTTIGYGDVVPQTAWGRIMATIIGIISVGMVALPAGLLASGFSEALHRRRVEFENLVLDALSDGEIDESEESALRIAQEATGLSGREAASILKNLEKRHKQLQQRCPHCGKPIDTGGGGHKRMGKFG